MNKALQNGASFANDYMSYSKAMWFIFTIPPAIGYAISVLPTLRYEITNKEHQDMLSALIERHGNSQNSETENA
jgi:Na+/melibiose symporter-like transporter